MRYIGDAHERKLNIARGGGDVGGPTQTKIDPAIGQLVFLNHLELPNPLIFGSIDHDANIAQAVSVQQQSERTAPTEFRDEFDDFSTPPNVDFLKRWGLMLVHLYTLLRRNKNLLRNLKNLVQSSKDKKQSEKLSKEKHLAGSSRDHSEPRVSLDKDKVVHNVEMRDADKTFSAGEEKLSLSKSDSDDIKFYVKTYFMVDHYTGFLGVLKEDFASYGKRDHPQSLNEHKMDAKRDNVVDNAGQLSKVGGNEGGVEECLKETESSYTEKVQEEDRHNIAIEVDEGIRDERVKLVDGIVQQSSGTLDCGLFVASYGEYLSDRHQISFSNFDPEKYCTRYASLLWDYGVNKACNGYVSDNQDPPRPKHTFIPSEDTKMIDVEP
ncbi:putative protein EIN4-like [Capsicum annuum]|nr:putative protein EIN4-like [Capsicum annuum]